MDEFGAQGVESINLILARDQTWLVGLHWTHSPQPTTGSLAARYFHNATRPLRMLHNHPTVPLSLSMLARHWLVVNSNPVSLTWRLLHNTLFLLTPHKVPLTAQAGWLAGQFQVNKVSELSAAGRSLKWAILCPKRPTAATVKYKITQPV